MYIILFHKQNQYILCIIFYMQALYGGIAQLGECLTGSQKVTGSSPVISTNYFFYVFYNKTVIIMTLINLERNYKCVL